MASSPTGFSQHAATLGNHVVRKDMDLAFKKSLTDFQQMLKETQHKTDHTKNSRELTGDIDWARPSRTSRYARRVLIPTDQPLDVERILLLNRLYGAEAKFLTTTEEHLNTQHFKEREPDQQTRFPSPLVPWAKRQAMLEVVKDKIRRWVPTRSVS